MKKIKILLISALVLNLIYLIITFFFFYLLDSSLMNRNSNDFLTFYEAGRLIITDLSNLYNPSQYLFPFRYFPFSAYFFTPFSILGLNLGYFVFQIFNFFLNIINIYLIYKIANLYLMIGKNVVTDYKLDRFEELFSKSENKPILHQFAIFLIILPQFMNYFLGQINNLVSLFLLISIYSFLKKDEKYDFLGGLMLGLAISIKPTLILLIPFIFPLYYSKEIRKFRIEYKKIFYRLSGIIIILFLSGLYFLIYPKLLEDFIEINFSGKYTTTIGTIDINASFSLTRNLITLFQIFDLEFNFFLLFIILIVIFWLPLYLFFIFSDNDFKIISGYLSGILITLIVYFDSWPHHLIVLTPFLIIFILFHKDFKLIRSIRYIYYFFSIFVVISWGIFYLTYQIFPFNLCGLILSIILYSILIIFFRKTILDK